jgi:hypothetical protein
MATLLLIIITIITKVQTNEQTLNILLSYSSTYVQINEKSILARDLLPTCNLPILNVFIGVQNDSV